MNQKTQPQFEIRRVKPSQWREMWNIHLDALAQSPQSFKGSYDYCRSIPEQAAEDFAANGSTSSEFACFLAWAAREDPPIGEITLRIDELKNPDSDDDLSNPSEFIATVIAIWVRPECRKSDVGSKLMHAAENWAKIQCPGLAGFQLHVQSENRGVTKFYAKHGYSVPDTPDGEEMILWKQCR